MSKSAPQWHRFAQARDLEIEPGCLLVRFPDGRGHRLRVIEKDDGWLLRGLIVRHARSNYDAEPAFAAARRNRNFRLFGLRLDEKGSLIGESHVPMAGLTASEFQTHARHVAAACDRLEYLITSGDREARAMSDRIGPR